MSDPQRTSAFEARFERAVRLYAGEGIRAYEPELISQRARAADHGRRRWWLAGQRLSVEPRLLRLALLVGLLGAAVALAVAGSRRPALPRPGLLAVGASSRIVMIDPGSGTLRPVTTPTAHDGWPVWSPDGTSLAFSQDDGRGPLEVIDAEGGRRRSLSDGIRVSGPAAWSMDGTRIAFAGSSWPAPAPDPSAADPGLDNALYVVGLDGSAPVRLVTNIGASRIAWSPDDSKISFVGWSDSSVGGADGDIHLVDAASGRVTLISRSPVDGEIGGALALAWRPRTSELLYADVVHPVDGRAHQDIVLARPVDGAWQVRPLVTGLPMDPGLFPLWLDSERFVFVRDNRIVVAGADGTDLRVLGDAPITHYGPGCVAPDGSALVVPVEEVPDVPSLMDLLILRTDGGPSIRIATGGYLDGIGAVCSWQSRP